MGCEICCSYLNFISTERLKSYHVQPLAIIRKVFQGVNGHNNASSYALAAEQDVTAQRAVIAIREAKGDISFATQNVRTFSAASVHWASSTKVPTSTPSTNVNPVIPRASVQVLQSLTGTFCAVSISNICRKL